jgi:ligand-binding sensor domain-containing protein
MKAKHVAVKPGSLLLRFYISLAAFVCALLIPCTHTAAQQYTYTQYTEKDGLAGSTVYGMIQDRQGFLWFATETGVSRFDGVHFTNFTTADGLPANEVFGICPDSYGRLWMISFSKMICYYKNGKIYNSSNNDFLRRIRNESLITNISEDADKNIIIRTIDSTIVLSGQEISYHPRQYSYTLDKYSWLHTGINTGKKEQPGKEFNSLPDNIKKWAKDYFPELTFIISRNKKAAVPGICFIETGDDLLMLDARKAAPLIQTIPTTLNYYAFLDSNRIAVKQTSTFLIYDVRKGEMKEKYTLPCVVNEMFIDREGEYWFSTRGQGLFKLASPSFENYKCTFKGISFSVSNIQQRGKDIYAGDDNGGFWKYNSSLHELSRVKNIRKDFLFPDDILINPCQYIMRQAYPAFYKKLSFPAKSVFKQGDKLLIASSADVRLVKVPEMRIIDTIATGRSTCALESSGSYYVGTLNGLYKIDKAKSKIYLGALDKELSSRISFIAKSPDGIIWVATSRNGVIGLKNDKIFARVAYLEDKVCLCLYISGNSMWAGTNKGLYKIELASGRYVAVSGYNAFDGLGSDIVNCVFVSDGKVYAGTSAGFTVFDEYAPVNSFSLLYLTGITVSGREVSFNNSNKTVLPHNDNNIRFQFAGLSYRSGNEILYSYRLAGLDTAWRTTKESYLAYPSLPSGSYTLEIIAVNRFRGKSNPVSFDFTILPSVWEKWWVRLLIVLLFALSVITFVKIRIRQIKTKSEYIIAAQKRMTELEQMALRAQMNPHFIFNCLNSIQNFTIKQDIKGANIYLTRFAGLIRQTLENSPKLLISLKEEIAYLTNYIELERLQMAGGFEFEIRTTFNTDEDATRIPNMVVQPYLENAIKHGLGSCSFPVPKLSVSFSKESEMLICIIEDNGPGISSNKQRDSNDKHTSMGMSITAKRIEMLNLVNKGAGRHVSAEVQNIRDLNPHLSGTRVILKFPL